MTKQLITQNAYLVILYSSVTDNEEHLIYFEVREFLAHNIFVNPRTIFMMAGVRIAGYEY